jgi:hypothetical protein
VSDNGTPFCSKEAIEFYKRKGIKYHKTIAPYHPATNGQAERCVQTVKEALTNAGLRKGHIEEDVNTFLLQYRIAPHSTTGQSPAKLFLGRELQTRLNLAVPKVPMATRVVQEPEKRRTSTQPEAKFTKPYRTFKLKDIVHFRVWRFKTERWQKGRVHEVVGDLHYMIESNGQLFHRHVDHIRMAESATTTAVPAADQSGPLPKCDGHSQRDDVPLPTMPETATPPSPRTETRIGQYKLPPPRDVPRRSERERRQPKRLIEEVEVIRQWTNEKEEMLDRKV